MTHASAQMQAYYAARAPEYDDVYRRPERRADIAFLSAYLPSRFAGRDALEVACGTGFWTQFIAASARSLVATDSTAEPLRLAGLRPNASGVSFRQADAYELTEELGFFDAAFAGLWFSHVPIGARATFFASLHSCLLPGAFVVLLDNSTIQCVELPITERDAEGNGYQMRRLKDGSAHRVLKNFPTEPELRSLVASFASSCTYRELENFWLFEYELASAE